MTSPEQTMAAVVDSFLPAAEGLPSASELGVHRRLLVELLRLAALELARLHRAAGAERIVPLVTPPLEWHRGRPFEPYLDALKARPIASNRVLLFTAHQMSSCRIGLSPRTSAADPDGQVHGVRGLWVTDSSAMPSASGVNPMLSLMALAHRTATRMRVVA